MSASRYCYLTTPIYYVNDKPHIGHGYTSIATDVMARFKRLEGVKVKFLTGTDEHGQKIQQSAQKAGMTPKAFTDQVSQTFRDMSHKLNLSNDDFIRTTEDRHYKAVHHLWDDLMEKGYIYLDSYSGWYAIRDEAFYQETELVDGKAPTGAEVEWVSEPSYFFKLSSFQERLLEYYKNNPDFIMPASRKNEVVKFVEGGLKDLSVSRTSFSWGIPVTKDPSHVMYVWFDALTNYLSALGYPNNQENLQTLWPTCTHVVGKDILRFHTVYWPAFLMAADLPLPKRIVAHGWWTNEGQKISKSLGNTIDPLQLVQDYGLDTVRYFLLREMSFGQDCDFSKSALISRNNSDLANAYGNLVQRIFSFIYKNTDGAVPALKDLKAEDETLLKESADLLSLVQKHMDDFAFHKALETIWAVIYKANAYVDFQKPWSLKKEDPKRMEVALSVLVKVIYQITLLLQAFMPDSCSKILDTLGVSKDARTFETPSVSR